MSSSTREISRDDFRLNITNVGIFELKLIYNIYFYKIFSSEKCGGNFIWRKRNIRDMKTVVGFAIGCRVSR